MCVCRLLSVQSFRHHTSSCASNPTSEANEWGRGTSSLRRASNEQDCTLFTREVAIPAGSGLVWSGLVRSPKFDRISVYPGTRLVRCLLSTKLLKPATRQTSGHPAAIPFLCRSSISFRKVLSITEVRTASDTTYLRCTLTRYLYTFKTRCTKWAVLSPGYAFFVFGWGGSVRVLCSSQLTCCALYTSTFGNNVLGRRVLAC